MSLIAVVPSDAEALPQPRPLDAPVSGAQLEAMLRRALALAGTPVPGRDEWVVVKPNIVLSPGICAQYGPGAVTDLRVVRALLAWLREGFSGRITIAEGAGGWRRAATDGWNTDWNGDFDGLSYQALARHFDTELLDLNEAETVEHRSSGRTFRLARAVRDCQRLFSLSPLKTNKGAVVSLAMKNLFGVAPGAVYGFPKFGLHALGPVPELVGDIFAFRPDTCAILGGSWCVEGAGDQPLRHNVMVAGADAVAADAVASMVMGFDPLRLDFLQMAQARGLGCANPCAIQVCGARPDAVRRAFLPPFC